MAVVAFVGLGPDLYQVWLGGSPDQAGRTGWQWIDKMKAADMETTLEVLTFTCLLVQKYKY
jgi:sulfite reductase (ferredoxin)